MVEVKEEGLMNHRAILAPPPPPGPEITPEDIARRYWEITLRDWPQGFELKVPRLHQPTAVYILHATVMDRFRREAIHFYQLARFQARTDSQAGPSNV